MWADCKLARTVREDGTERTERGERDGEEERRVHGATGQDAANERAVQSKRKAKRGAGKHRVPSGATIQRHEEERLENDASGCVRLNEAGRAPPGALASRSDGPRISRACVARPRLTSTPAVSLISPACSWHHPRSSLALRDSPFPASLMQVKGCRYAEGPTAGALVCWPCAAIVEMDRPVGGITCRRRNRGS